MSHIYDLAITDSGPAGLMAAVCAQRAKLGTLTVEKAIVSGGQVLTTYEVDNYSGFPGIGGYDLGIKSREHADRLGVRFVENEVLDAQDRGKDATKGMMCRGSTYEARFLILTIGAVYRKLGALGKEELVGVGVSYRAICDGTPFRNRVTAVIRGGDVAVEDAIFLACMCNRVHLIRRENELRAIKSLQENLLSLDSAEVIQNIVVDSTNEDGMVKSLSLTSIKNGQKRELDVQGMLIAVGIAPESRVFEGLVDVDHGYIRAGKDTVTSAPGILAAGDVGTRPFRQTITVAADGVNAITSMERCLVENWGRQATDE